MNWLDAFLQTRMDVVYFVYGLSFVVAGVAILTQPKEMRRFRFTSIVWLFAAYTLLHSPADFLNAWMADVGRNAVAERTAEILTLASFLFLFEFGRRLAAGNSRGIVSRTLPWWALPSVAVAVIAASLASADFWKTLDVLFGYFIRAPAGILGAAGFFLYLDREDQPAQIRRAAPYFRAAGVAFLLWTVFCGFFRTKAGFFPANLLNSESFRDTVGAPVQLFRTVCGIVAAWAVLQILAILRRETIGEYIRTEAADHYRRDALDIQTATNTVLRVAIEEGTLEELLRRVLETIVHIPWLSVEGKGAVFLADRRARVLEMRAEIGLNENIRRSCAVVPFGKCLCGQAMETSSLQYADGLDDRHTILYHGIAEHGHYVVPMRFRSETIGVLNLYLRKGHAREAKEEEFLTIVADALSILVIRSRAEDAYRESQRRQAALLANIPDMVWLKDKDSRFIAVNDAFGRAVGAAPEGRPTWMSGLGSRPRSSAPTTPASCGTARRGESRSRSRATTATPPGWRRSRRRFSTSAARPWGPSASAATSPSGVRPRPSFASSTPRWPSAPNNCGTWRSS